MKKILRTPKRRRIECKTDYSSRVELLKSKKPRLALRKTNKYIIAQIVVSETAQDKIVFGITSKDLLAKGWPKENIGSLKSLPAAYLTGFLLGKKAAGKVKEAILDIGLHRNIKQSRIYAAVKGFVDAGIKVPCNPESLPSTERISASGKMKDAINKLKAKL
jgi:large subunit ribosomal protein L18